MISPYTQRSSSRIPFQTVVELYWRTPDGAEVRERAHTENVCRTGALVQMQDYWKDLFSGSEVTVRHRLLKDLVQARVVDVRRIAGGKLAAVALELSEPVLWDRL
jgi:hypothetical protein